MLNLKSFHGDYKVYDWDDKFGRVYYKLSMLEQDNTLGTLTRQSGICRD